MRITELNIIHPGHVVSKNDGDIHFIGYDLLIRLYKLNPRFCEKYDPHIKYSIVARHYYPRYDGDYSISNG
jgi:hypothetical protein